MLPLEMLALNRRPSLSLVLAGRVKLKKFWALKTSRNLIFSSRAAFSSCAAVGPVDVNPSVMAIEPPLPLPPLVLPAAKLAVGFSQE
ncbi:hypothetical protein D3C78_1774110 [compost metagenome]